MDQISRGRLIFGIGRSGNPRAYEAYGVPYEESRERFAETLEIILKAWTEPTFSYEGRWHSYSNVGLAPKPFQKPYPEIRIAANSPASFVRFGERGHSIFVGLRQGEYHSWCPTFRPIARLTAWLAIRATAESTSAPHSMWPPRLNRR